MKRSIFVQKLGSKKFRAVYEAVSGKMNIGEQISEYRHKAKMSQAELAKKVNTSRTAIARYESGKYDKYNIVTLQRIARALNKKLTISFSDRIDHVVEKEKERAKVIKPGEEFSRYIKKIKK